MRQTACVLPLQWVDASLGGLQECEAEAVCHLDFHRERGPMRQPSILSGPKRVCDSAPVCSSQSLPALVCLGSLDLLEHCTSPKPPSFIAKPPSVVAQPPSLLAQPTWFLAYMSMPCLPIFSSCLTVSMPCLTTFVPCLYTFIPCLTTFILA